MIENPRAVDAAIEREKAKRCFRDFVIQAWPIVEPAVPFVSTWHIDAICDHLEALAYGWIRKLVINVPPGHAKSMLVDVLFPAWVWGPHGNPEWRSLFSSYDQRLTSRDSVKCRNIIRDPWYRANFATARPESPIESERKGWELKDDMDLKSYFANTREGFRICFPVGTGTGHRGHLVAVDDPMNAKAGAQYSAAKRESVIEWWDQTMGNRLLDMRTGRHLIIMQRLHEQDLTGHVLEQGGYEHLMLPSEFEERERVITYCTRPTMDGSEPVKEEFFSDPRTQDGELLFPDMFPQEVLDGEKTRLGTAGYAAQHKQKPSPKGGEILLAKSWRFWKADGAPDNCPRPSGCWDGPARVVPEKFDQVLISLDAAFKDQEQNDSVCFHVWGAKGADRYLLDEICKRMSFTKTILTFLDLIERYPKAVKRLVEDKANGSAIIDAMRANISGLIEINPEGGKESRAWAVQPQVESGNVYLKDGAPWVPAFVGETSAFPRGKHDDRVDAMTQALVHLTPSDGARRLRKMVKNIRGART